MIQRTFLFDDLKSFWNNQPKIHDTYIKKQSTNTKIYIPTSYCLQYMYNYNYTNLSRKYPEFIAKEKSEDKFNYKKQNPKIFKNKTKNIKNIENLKNDFKKEYINFSDNKITENLHINKDFVNNFEKKFNNLTIVNKNDYKIKKFQNKYEKNKNSQNIRLQKLQNKNGKINKNKCIDRNIYSLNKNIDDNKNISIINLDRTFDFNTVLKIWNDRIN